MHGVNSPECLFLILLLKIVVLIVFVVVVVCFNTIKCAFERGKYLMLPSCQNSARFLPKMKSEAHVKPCAVSSVSQCSLRNAKEPPMRGGEASHRCVGASVIHFGQ